MWILLHARAADVDAAGVDAAGVDAAGVDAAGVDAAGVDAAGVSATAGRWSCVALKPLEATDRHHRGCSDELQDLGPGSEARYIECDSAARRRHGRPGWTEVAHVPCRGMQTGQTLY